MKMKKKLFGILAFVLVTLCALGFAFGFTACSSDNANKNTVVDDGKDPIIGTWKGDVSFSATLGSIPFGTFTADTLIVVDETTFSLTVTIDIAGIASFEDYKAIENASWYKDEETGEYHALANISEVDYDIPIQVYKTEDGNYEMSLTTEIGLVISGVALTATFDNATVTKVS